MSDFLAEARVVVLPDTKGFRAALEAQLKAIHVAPLSIPIVAAGAGAAAATAALGAAQQQAAGATQQLTGLANIENTTFAKQAVILEAVTRETLQKAGADSAAAGAAGKHAQAQGQLQKGLFSSLAAMTGLRGAVLAASGPFLAAAIASTAFLKSLQEFSAFEQELNVFAATTEATGEEMAKVSDLATKLGADLSLPSTSASDAATAMTELAKAGLSVEDAMAGARGVLQLSTAAGISTAEAAQFAANELNAFALAGDQAVRVADVLANAANSAQGSISDFGLAFKQSAAVANQVGLSFEATAAQLAVMARAGLQGSDAGTSLRVALLRLINPTKAAQQVLDELGIDLRDVNGNIRPDVFVQFAEATERMAPALRDANAAVVFGADGIRTLAVSAQAGRDGLLESTAAIVEQGTASEVAQARTAGFGGQVDALKSSAATAALSLGELSTVIAGPLVTGLTAFAQGIDLVLKPFADLVALTKEKLGIGQFDAATQSAADLLAQLERLRAAQGEVSKETAGDSLTEGIRVQTENTIRALEGQRAVLRSMGIDVSGITALIQRLQNELVAVGSAGVSGATAAQQALLDLDELITQLGDKAPEGLKTALKEMRDQVQEVSREQGRFTQQWEDGFDRMAKSVDPVVSALKRLKGEVGSTAAALLKAQNEGASPQTQLGLLQAQEQQQFDRIDLLKKNGIEPGEATAIRESREEIERIQGEIESIQRGIAADQKAAATEAEKIAKDAQDDRDKQFEAIASMFGGRQDNIENAIERAGIRGNVQAQIRLNKALIASLEKERAALLERLRTLKVSNDVRKKILEAISDAIDDARNDILRLQQDQKKKVEEFATPGADARIRIAQARDNVAAEIRARRAKLELITKELVRLKNAGKKNTLAWLELKAQQAEEIAAIKALREQDQGDTKTARQKAAEFLFSQLQAQQGFAANLMGNLITGPTEGLVGVPSPSTSVRRESAAAEARATFGPSAGQTNTQTNVLEKILVELRKLNGSYDAPEAINNKKTGAATMDSQPM